jgi:hypothetical protein
MLTTSGMAIGTATGLVGASASIKSQSGVCRGVDIIPLCTNNDAISSGACCGARGGLIPAE